jgi:hypothetical protein
MTKQLQEMSTDAAMNVSRGCTLRAIALGLGFVTCGLWWRQHFRTLGLRPL